MSLVMVFAVVALGLAAWHVHRVRQVHTAWLEVSQLLGLSITSATSLLMPTLSGEIDGIVVAVTSGRGGQSEGDYTYYEVMHPASGPPVRIARHHAISRFAGRFGRTGVLVGDPFFDDQVMITTANEHDMLEFLTPSRQAAILQLFDRFTNCVMQQHIIAVETIGIETNTRYLAGTIRRLVDIAKVMSDSTVVDAALSKQHAGAMAEAVNDLHAANEDQPNFFTAMLEAEALIEMGERDAASHLFQVVDDQLTDARPTDGWEALAGTPMPLVLPAQRIEKSIDATQQQVIDDLFDTKQLSYEIVQRFDETYAGSLVTWSGTVTSYSSYRHDSDFGPGPGIKAVVLLGTVGKSRLISNEVQAVIGMPASVELSRDTVVTFTGVLMRVDRFARKVYVSNARPEQR